MNLECVYLRVSVIKDWYSYTENKIQIANIHSHNMVFICMCVPMHIYAYIYECGYIDR